jgi:phage gp45-like
MSSTLQGVQNQVDKLYRRLLMSTAPVAIQTTDDSGTILRTQIAVHGTPEVIDRVPLAHFYGFHAVPPAKTDALALFVGGDRSNPIIVGTNNQQARPKNWKAGEVGHYTDEGDSITLNRGNNINVTAKTGFKVDTKTATIKGSQEVVHDTPNSRVTDKLTLAHDPLAPLEAATKRYVDAAIAASGGGGGNGGGGTHTITLNGDVLGTGTDTIPTTVVALQHHPIAPTLPIAGDYLGWDDATATWEPRPGSNVARATIGDTPPASPAAGATWWDSVRGQLYLWYDDGTSSQWVPSSNQPGPPGETGAAGPQGPIGNSGPAGPQGATGAVGATGGVGPQGPMGLTGPQGATGAASTVPGPAGATGATGPQGSIGLTGATGPAGAQGPIGNTGSAGAQGPTGATGAQGPKGDTGATGAASTVPGPTGPQGIAGPTGATGSQGPTGAIGNTGPQGPIGNSGPAGATGPQGPIGLTGATGPQGPNIAIGDTAPASPAVGSAWWDSAGGHLYLWFNDGTSSQWVGVG